MNIFYVTCWGNHKDGPDGDDTSYVILENSYELAASTVDAALLMIESKFKLFANRITEIGVSEATEGRVLVGPVVESALFHDDLGIQDSKKWIRDSLDEGWIEFSEYYED